MTDHQPLSEISNETLLKELFSREGGVEWVAERIEDEFKKVIKNENDQKKQEEKTNEVPSNVENSNL